MYVRVAGHRLVVDEHGIHDIASHQTTSNHGSHPIQPSFQGQGEFQEESKAKFLIRCEPDYDETTTLEKGDEQ